MCIKGIYVAFGANLAARRGAQTMPAGGDYQINTHPGLGRRMTVAACIALCLVVIGLVVAAHAATPPAPIAAVSQSAF